MGAGLMIALELFSHMLIFQYLDNKKLYFQILQSQKKESYFP